jgi:hypothetical protein
MPAHGQRLGFRCDHLDTWPMPPPPAGNGSIVFFFTKTTLYIKQLSYKSNLQRMSSYKKVLGPEQQRIHQETADEEAAGGELGCRQRREQQGGMTAPCVG